MKLPIGHPAVKTLRLQLLSDLHNEFDTFKPAATEADIVILAGDIDTGTRGVEWAARTFSCPVLYVAGNHEYYRGHLLHTLRKMRAAATEQVHVLDRNALVLNGVRFLGATAWTDYQATGNRLEAMEVARLSMNDYRLIRVGDFRLARPVDFDREAGLTHAWLAEQLAQPFDGPTVVITHHAPLMQSVEGHPESGTHLDAAFANHWDDLFVYPIDCWVHGHVHQALDYHHRSTRVVCNPRGYPGEVTGWSSTQLIELRWEVRDEH